MFTCHRSIKVDFLGVVCSIPVSPIMFVQFMSRVFSARHGFEHDQLLAVPKRNLGVLRKVKPRSMGFSFAYVQVELADRFSILWISSMVHQHGLVWDT